MALYFLIFLTSFLVVFICTPSLIRVSIRKNLTDAPGDLRKLHTKSIPTLGGVMIFAGTLFSFTLLLPTVSVYLLKGNIEPIEIINDASYLMAAMLVLFFIGIKDDIIGTAAIFKLLGHIIIGMILVLMGNIRITGFHGLFGIYAIPYWGSVFLSVFTYVVVVNAINFIDGIDGLAAGIGLIGATAFGIWFASANSPVFGSLAFALSGSLLGFLIYNFSPAKIFMGDSGSLIVGLVLSVLGIKLIEYDPAQLPANIVSISRPLFVMSVLAYPLIDALRIVIYRSLKGVSPLEADRNHIHHALLDMKLNHSQISAVLYSYTIIIICLSVLVRNLDSTWVFVIVGGFAIISLQIPLIIRVRRRKLRKMNSIVKELERHQAM
jgi:UDP-N-acetylmuramyl pentapeptide phosphotransferase/UDP-N-acetylglucosamine-1-phosphate transferase